MGADNEQDRTILYRINRTARPWGKFPAVKAAQARCPVIKQVGKLADNLLTKTNSKVPPPQINLAAAAEILGVTEFELKEALGNPTQDPPDFEAAAQILGVMVEELIEALGLPPGGPGQGGSPSGSSPSIAQEP